MAKYIYPDFADRIPALACRAIAGGNGSHPISDEAAIRSAVAATLKMRVEYVRALDVGTGVGRLLGVLDGMCAEIMALDPDENRLKKARRSAPLSVRRKTRFVKGDLHASTVRDRFDLLLCAYVIQHIATFERRSFCKALGDLMAPDGMLIMLLPVAASAIEAHLISSLSRDTVMTREVTHVEFDKCIAGQRQGGGGLPVWHPTLADVHTLLMGNGLEAIKSVKLREFEYSVIRSGVATSAIAIDTMITARPKRIPAP